MNLEWFGNVRRETMEVVVVNSTVAVMAGYSINNDIYIYNFFFILAIAELLCISSMGYPAIFCSSFFFLNRANSCLCL